MSNPTPLGVELLNVLKKRSQEPFEYYNPHFLLALTTLIDEYYNLEDDSVDNWVQDMFGS